MTLQANHAENALSRRWSSWPGNAMWPAARGWPARWRTGGGAHAVIDYGGIDVRATDLIGMCRPPVPHVFDAQHRATLFGGDALA